MSKLKKSIIVVVCLVILVVPFTVGAEKVEMEEVSFETGNFKFNYVGASLLRGGNIIPCDVTFLKFETDRVRVNILPQDTYMQENDIVFLSFRLIPVNSAYLNSNKNVVGAFSVGMRLDSFKSFQLVSGSLGDEVFRKDSVGGVTQYPSVKNITSHWGKYYRLIYDEKSKGNCYDQYDVMLSYTVSTDNYDYSRYVYVQDFEFETLTDKAYEDNRWSEIIGGEVGKHTDTITNGWGGGTKIDDSSIGALKDAQDSALGGKTDNEIKTDLESNMDFDMNSFDTNNMSKMHTLFNDVLDVCGNYRLLFLLSLTLGLAAFLIGRRYG